MREYLIVKEFCDMIKSTRTKKPCFARGHVHNKGRFFKIKDDVVIGLFCATSTEKMQLKLG